MEEVLDPELAICDPHHHLWEHPGSRYMLEELQADSRDGHRVVCTVFIECMSGYHAEGPVPFRPVGETEFVVAADPGGFVAGIVGFADLRAPEIEDVLAAHVEAGAGRFRGVRHASGWDANPAIRPSHTDPPPDLFDDPAFHRGLDALERAGLGFDAWLYHPQIPKLTELARAHPGLPIVLDHLGGPLGVGPYRGRRAEVLEAWRAALDGLASCPNVVLKLGGIGMPIFGMVWHHVPGGATSEQLADVWGAELRWCIERFGVDRCMFESNFPVDRVSCSYRTLWNAFKRVTAAAGPDEKAALFHDTARRFYRV